MAETERASKRQRKDGQAVSACKTCVACRRKKVRCDSARPTCHACAATGCECVYVEDTRRLTRPSWQAVQRLEANVASLWERVKDAEARAADGQRADLALATQQEHAGQTQPVLKTSSSGIGAARSPSARPSTAPLLPDGDDVAAGGRLGDDCEANELSPQELSVVGFIQSQDGAVSVHGMSSLLHAATPATKTTQRSQSQAYQDQERIAAQARLVSNAALQRQRELRLFRSPCNTLDLDGLDSDTARHLFDLHWNRQHYAYLLTYRPAVMESLWSAGPWANKLLLNAIYYSSSVYSDRPCFEPANGSGTTAGSRFFCRFKELLVDALVEPSITSAAALLLMGSNMASQGNLSAGWNFCGLGYRMIVDLGGHLMTGLRQSSGDAGSIQRDIEREMRKRIYWGAFIIDTTQSLYFGRPTSLPLAEARMPTELLDTYEELEEWAPYVDPTMSLPSDELLLSYMPQPVYAVSTFLWLARLFRVGSRVVRAFYSLESVRISVARANDLKARLELELGEWLAALPEHLHFNPMTDATPPPHQINPHTSYHALVILLKRPFSRTGHLRHCITESEKTKDTEECVASALMIWKLVAAYRSAFTLRRAAYLVVYAMYSAVVVLLATSKDDRAQHSAAISFFWSSLSEQKQWFAGLHKPMTIIRDTMNEFGQSGILTEYAKQADPAMDDLMQILSGTDNLPCGPPKNTLSDANAMSFTQSDESNDYLSFDFLENHEKLISDDALFGLFAPYQGIV